MRLAMIIRVAWRALGRNKFRTFLTMLGIIIGVAAVITMVSLGQGAQQSVQDAIATMGTNVIFLFPGVANQGGVRGGTGTYLNLKAADVAAVAEQCESVRYVSPLVRRNFQVVYSGQNWYTSVQGVDADYFLIREWTLVEGQPLSDISVSGAAKVC
ncbi:MAG TPA: ABC transporter permease, partial [Candidatus Xenobia bacterium]